MKNYYGIILLSVMLFFLACARIDSQLIETIKVTPSVPQEEFFSDFVQSIEVVPLETEEDIFIRNKRIMEVYNGDLYISNVDNGFRDDSRGESNIILRFDRYGKFLNKIGRYNRKQEPGSYFFYKNFYLDSIICIFSEPDCTVNKYKLSGEPISQECVAPLKAFKQAAYFNKAYVVNIASYSPEEENMLLFYNRRAEIISRKIPLKTRLRPSATITPSFTKYNNMLLYRDEYIDTIYQISKNLIVTPRLYVDYGEERRENKKHFIKNFSKASDWDNYLTKPHSGTNLYYESGFYCLLQISEYGQDPVSKKFQTVWRMALKDKISGRTAFVDFNRENTMFQSAVQCLEGKKLFFLVQARYLTRIPGWMRPYFTNYSILETIKPEDNDLVFIFNLK